MGDARDEGRTMNGRHGMPEVEALVATAWREIRGRQLPEDSVQEATDTALLAITRAASARSPTPPMHPLRSILVWLAALTVQSAYGEDVGEAEAEARKIRATELRELADSIAGIPP